MFHADIFIYAVSTRQSTLMSLSKMSADIYSNIRIKDRL